MEIGELSRRSGVNIETIRYYERIGVLPKPVRQQNGRRTYVEGDARRLGFVRHARALGFDLPDVQTLLSMQERPEQSCAEASRIAEAQLSLVEERIVKLESLRAELRHMVAECGRGVVAECRIIECLGA
jgi:DNA-binding transcriptional MerR regulator